MSSISRLTKVPLRELWKHEAHNFTHWLADNLAYLNDALQLELSLVEREASGNMSFSADILAEDKNNNYYVIENQLEKTDHGHLGQIITYMSNLGAKNAIWITSEPRPEHETAVHWLNELLPDDSAIYLVKLEAYKIDDSSSAPLFTVVAGPTSVGKQIGNEKKELAGFNVLHTEFWGQLLQRSKNKTSLFANISPGKESWISASAGRGGIAFDYVIRKNSGSVELYINTGNADDNKRHFDKLFSKKYQIEQRFEQSINWERLDHRKASQLSFVAANEGLASKERWPEIQDKMIEAMIRFSDALKPEIKDL